jgi:nitrogen-specific signal transduction histidine kinase
MQQFNSSAFNKAICLKYNKQHLKLIGGTDSPVPDEQQTIDNLTFKYNAIFNRPDRCCIIMDRYLNVVDFNDAAYQLIKKVFNCKLCRGRYIGQFLNAEQYDGVIENCMQALSGDTIAVQRCFDFKDADLSWWQAEYAPAYNHVQHIGGVVFSANNISQLKALELKVEQQEQRLHDIALMQSHEIRQPLCTLMGLISLLKMEGVVQKSEYLPMIDTTVQLLDIKIKAIIDSASKK